MATSIQNKLQASAPVVGALATNMCDETLLPVLLDSGYDFLMLDCEHGSFGWERVEHLCRIGRLIGLPIVVRCMTSYETIRRHVDMGATGIITPMNDTPEHLAALRDACFLPPLGRRGPGGPGNEHLADYSLESWRELESELVLLPQVETRRGMQNLDLFAEDWITGVMIGPYDLMMDLGLPFSEYAAPGSAHEAALFEIIRGLADRGKPCAMVVADGESARRWLDAGCQIVVCGELSNMVGQQARHNLAAINA
jgi:2-keto-3-deoxy-L-rhamnonate aldolase RhmA